MSTKDFDDLYAELPSIDCQGMCWDSCGPIDMTGAERVRIRRETGVDIPAGSFLRHGPSACPALGMLHTCTVYDVRPLICRIWGLTRRLRCNYGCRPDRVLTEPEAYEFIARAHEIAGEHESARIARLATRPEYQERMRQAHAVIDAETDLILYRRNGDLR